MPPVQRLVRSFDGNGRTAPPERPRADGRPTRAPGRRARSMMFRRAGMVPRASHGVGERRERRQVPEPRAETMTASPGGATLPHGHRGSPMTSSFRTGRSPPPRRGAAMVTVAWAPAHATGASSPTPILHDAPRGRFRDQSTTWTCISSGSTTLRPSTTRRRRGRERRERLGSPGGTRSSSVRDHRPLGLRPVQRLPARLLRTVQTQRSQAALALPFRRAGRPVVDPACTWRSAGSATSWRSNRRSSSPR